VTFVTCHTHAKLDDVAEALPLGASLRQDQELLDTLVHDHEADLKHVDVSRVQWFFLRSDRV